MEYKTYGKPVDDSGLLTGTSETKHDDIIKKKRTESLKRSIASEHFFASRNNLLQSSHSSNQNLLPFHEEKTESEHRDDVEKTRRAGNLQDMSQQSDTQIPSVVAGTAASIDAKDASETYQSKIQECDLSRRESSNSTIQDFTSNLEKDSHNDVTSTDRRDISAERSDIETASSSSLSKDESLGKEETQNFAHKKYVLWKIFSSSESKTVPKNKSISISAKEENISVSQECSSSGIKSLDTTVPIRLKKRHSDSRRNIDLSEDDDIFVGEHEEKKRSKIEVKQVFTSGKNTLISTSTEKYDVTHNVTPDKNIEDVASLCKRGAIPNNLKENIGSEVSAKEHHIENSSLIADTENSSKSAESGKDIPSMVEMDLDENVDLAQYKNMQNYVTSNSEVPIASAHESTSYDGEEDGCDVSQNVGNLLLTSNNNVTKDEKTIDQFSVTTSTSGGNFSERTQDEYFSIRTTNSSKSSSNSNYYDDNHASDSHSVDDDNSSDMEIEIKIKPKLKFRVSRKFSQSSLKETWSLLDKLLQMDHRTSERFKRRCTSRSPENNIPLDNNKNVIAETEGCDFVCDSSLTTTTTTTTIKDNVNNSQQRQNFQEHPILNESRNAIDHNQRGGDECLSMQSINAITTENCSESNKLACDTSDFGAQLQKTSTDDKQKTDEEQNSQNNTTLEETGNVGHSRGKGNEHVSSIKRKNTQMATENSPGSVKAAYDTLNVEEQLLRTSLDVTHSKARSIEKFSYPYVAKSTSLNASAPSKRAYSTLCQSEPLDLAPFQPVPLQLTPPQPTRPQLVPAQLTLPQPTRPQLVPPQTTSLQLAPQSASLQLAHSQPTRPQPIHSQVQPQPQLVPPLTLPQPTHPQLVPAQSTPSQPTRPQLVPSQLTSESTRSQLVPPQSAPFQSAPPQSTRSQLVSNNSILKYHLTHPPLSSQLTSHSIRPQLAPQSAFKSPSYNSAPRHTYLSRRAPSQANAPVAPVGINTPNTPNINHDFTNLIQITVKRICAHIGYCREFIRSKRLSMHTKNTFSEYTQQMCMYIKQIAQDMKQLMVWLCTNDIECAITFVNQYTQINQPITLLEFNSYADLIQSYINYITHILQQNNAKSNASQHPNIGASVPNTSMPSVNPQPFSRGAPYPDAKVPNRGKSMQYSTMPCAVPTTSNVNQQQLFGNSANSPQVPHSKQTKPNIHQQYTCHVPSVVPSRMPNANQQQSLPSVKAQPFSRGAPYPDAKMPNRGKSMQYSTMQRPMPTTSNVNQQKLFGNSTNSLQVSHSGQPRPNIHQQYTCDVPSVAPSRMPNANQQQPLGNTNHPVQGHYMSPAGVSNVQQVFVNTSNVSSSNTNVRSCGPVNQSNANVPPAQSLEKAQYNRYLNSNELYHTFVPQSAHCNMQTHSVPNIQPDQNVQQKLQKSQRLILPKDTSICTIDLTTNEISQGMSQNTPNKGIKIPKSQSKDCMQNKASSMNPQDLYQGALSACNVSQNTSGTAPRTSTQRANILQNTMPKLYSEKDNTLLILPTSTYAQKNDAMFSIKDLNYNFNPAVLTDIQKILLRDQIHSYFLMSDQLKHSLNKQEFNQIHYERLKLYYLFQNLKNYIQNMIKKSQTTEKCVEKDSKNSTLQNRSVLQENTMQTFVDKLTKIQSNRDNKNSSTCNRNLEKQSSEQSIDSNISKNSRSTVIKNNLEEQNEESFFTPEFAIAKEPLIKDTRLQEQNNDTLMKKFQKSLLANMEKRSESSKATSLGRSEENMITEVFTKNSETKTQDNVKINESLKASWPGHSRTQEESSITEVSAKNSETGTQDNAKINESLKASWPGHTRTPEENSITEVSAKNSEAQDNAKINKSQSQKTASLFGKQFPKLNFLAQRSLNSLQDALTEKMEDQPEIAKRYNAIEKSNNVGTESVHKTSNVAILNNSGGNDATSRAPYNTEDQSKKVYNSSNEISSENLQAGMRDDVNENIEILNSTEIQSDPLNTLRDSSPTSNNIWRSSPLKTSESTEISQVHTTHEKHAETISTYLNKQQEDSMDEQSSNSSEEAYDRASENDSDSDSGKLYIDESVGESQEQEQCDKVSCSEDDSSMSQCSVWSFNAIKCDSTVKPLSVLKNMVEVADSSQDFVTEAQNTETLNEKPLEVNKILLQEVLPSKFKDKWNMAESTIQSIDIIEEQLEDIKEDSRQSLLEEVEEMQFEEMSSKFEVPEDASSTEESVADLSQYFVTEAQNIETLNEEPLEANKILLPKIPLKFEDEWNMAESTIQSIDIIKEQLEDIKEDSRQSLLEEVEEMQFEEMSSKFEVPEDASSTEESAVSICLKLPEDMEEEMMEVDTNTNIKTINEELKHMYQKYIEESRSSSCNSVKKEDAPVDVNVEEVIAKNVEVFAKNDDDIECISVKSDSSEDAITPNILNIRSISPSLFEKMENTTTFLQNNLESLNEKDEKSLDINDNLGILDEVNKPCLRCKRKSTVYCQACLEAHYCSKRCSSLHWKTEHYKQCKGCKPSIICIDV